MVHATRQHRRSQRNAGSIDESINEAGSLRVHRARSPSKNVKADVKTHGKGLAGQKTKFQKTLAKPEGVKEAAGREGQPGNALKQAATTVLLNKGKVKIFKSREFASLIDRDPVVARAITFLVHKGALTGSRSKKVSTRVDPGVMDAAKKRFGLSNESDVINASLAMAAAPDRFKAWLQDSQNTVTDDFELAV